MSEPKLRTLIAYGTYFGATAGTAEEIRKILQEEGFEVKAANVKEEKIKDISEYNSSSWAAVWQWAIGQRKQRIS